MAAVGVNQREYFAANDRTGQFICDLQNKTLLETNQRRMTSRNGQSGVTLINAAVEIIRAPSCGIYLYSSSALRPVTLSL
jgi:hypothetical protein